MQYIYSPSHTNIYFRNYRIFFLLIHSIIYPSRQEKGVGIIWQELTGDSLGAGIRLNIGGGPKWAFT